MIPAWVDEYVGIPFKPKGRDHDGADCWGLVWLIYREKFKLQLPSYYQDYEDTKKASARAISSIIEAAKQTEEWKLTTTPTIGDVLSLRLSGFPWHVGVVVGDGCMLHTQEGTDSCIEHYLNPKWVKRINGIYRHNAA